MNCWHRRCLLQSRPAVARRDLCRSSCCRNIYLQVFSRAFAFQLFSDQSAICIQEQEMLKRDLKIGFLFQILIFTNSQEEFFQNHSSFLSAPQCCHASRSASPRCLLLWKSSTTWFWRQSRTSSWPTMTLFLNKKRDRRNIWRWCLFHLVKSFTQAKLEF